MCVLRYRHRPPVTVQVAGPRRGWHGVAGSQTAYGQSPLGTQTMCRQRMARGGAAVRACATQTAQRGGYAAFGGRCGGAVTAERDVTTRPGTAARASTASTLAWASTSSWSGKSPLSSISAWSLASGNVSGVPCCECALSSVVSAHCGAEEGTFKPDALIPTHKRKWKIRTAVRRRSMVRAL